MSFIDWFLQKQCDHERRNLVVRTDKYANGSEDKMVYCRLCGKIILPSEDFDKMKELLGFMGDIPGEPS